MLINLGIKDTCCLHGDYYHLFREVWPKPENFGRLFTLIENPLCKMLKSTTVHEWKHSFDEASELLSQHPDKLQLLKDIYSKPDYYAGYYIRQINCNLNLNGSTIAEINHSSVVAHLGPGGLMTIMDQLSQLLTRQQFLYNKERDVEVRSIVSCHKYKSSFYGMKAKHDHDAKRMLSTYAHTKLFQVALGNSASLSCKVDTDGTSNIVWPTGQQQFEGNSRIIPAGARCDCLFRIIYDCQCKHELRISSIFKVEKWNQRHYNNKTFNELNPNMHIDQLSSLPKQSADDNFNKQ